LWDTERQFESVAPLTTGSLGGAFQHFVDRVDGNGPGFGDSHKNDSADKYPG